MDINVTEDLSILTNQIQQKIAELEQLTTKREQLTQEIHHLNGVAMYLRGKLPPSEEISAPTMIPEEQPEEEGEDTEEDSLERTNDYPES